MREKLPDVQEFKAWARLELRKHMRSWEYGEKDAQERLGIFPKQAWDIMCDTPSMSLERLLETLTRAGIKFKLERGE